MLTLTSAAAFFASPRWMSDVEVLDHSSQRTVAEGAVAAEAATAATAPPAHLPQQPVPDADATVLLKFGPCTTCSDNRHNPAQLASLQRLLTSQGYTVELQPFAAANRLEVWHRDERVFVLCDLRRLARGDHHARAAEQTILALLQQS